MRMDRRQPFSAWDVVNTYNERALADLLWTYGEERNSWRIARRIVWARPVDTTTALKDIVASAVGQRFLTKSLARVFQGIRIEVNAELKNLQKALQDSLDILSPGGRIVVISYHSLEDRMVKEFFRREGSTVRQQRYDPRGDRATVPNLLILTKKPVIPTAREVERNPRARSAKLRVAERSAE